MAKRHYRNQASCRFCGGKSPFHAKGCTRPWTGKIKGNPTTYVHPDQSITDTREDTKAERVHEEICGLAERGSEDAKRSFVQEFFAPTTCSEFGIAELKIAAHGVDIVAAIRAEVIEITYRQTSNIFRMNGKRCSLEEIAGQCRVPVSYLEGIIETSQALTERWRKQEQEKEKLRVVRNKLSDEYRQLERREKEIREDILREDEFTKACDFIRQEERMAVASEMDRLRDENMRLRAASMNLSIIVPPPTLAGIDGLMAIPGIAALPIVGIYFLCDLDEVVYVGQSVTLLSRVASHIGDKEFTRAYYLEVPQADLNRVEREWIDRLQPRYNRDMVTQQQQRKRRD